MNVSSRTPEGFPERCPLCNSLTNLEFSDPAGDAPCPNCGHLLWASSRLVDFVERRYGSALTLPSGGMNTGTLFADLGSDSLDAVEMVMELEEEFDIAIPDEVAENLSTVEDVLRYIRTHINKNQ